MERCQQRKHTNKFLRKRLDSGDHPLSHKSVAKENKANLGAPIEYDLPLTNAVSPLLTPKYWRDGGNSVGICGTVTFNKKLTNSLAIATLPVGYRPATSKNLIVKMAVVPHLSTYGWIEPDGRIMLAHVEISNDFIIESPFALIVSPFYAAN